MTRLIDADELLKIAMHPDAHDYVDAWDIAKAPTVDAVEVVRCKDCKYWKLVWDELHACICARGMLYTKANEYCSHGRKEKKCTKRR